MKISSYALVAVLAAASLGGGVALAKGGAPHMDAERFAEMDADQNGEITMDEMKAHREARFSAADSDGDGKLSVSEIAEQMRIGAERRAERMIARMDQDGDGLLGPDEMGRHGRKGHHGMHDDAKEEGHDGGHGRFFEKADTDGSGGLSMDEMMAMREKMGKRRHHGHDD